MWHKKVELQKGFGLVEIIIVAGMVAVLASVVMANVSEARKKARDTQRTADIAQLAIALRMYNDVYGTYNINNAVSGTQGTVWVSVGPIGGEQQEEEGGGGEETLPIDPIGGGETQARGGLLEYAQQSATAIDAFLHTKGYLPVAQLRDPKLLSDTDYGYLLAICDSGRRYALYATKEIPVASETAYAANLCMGSLALLSGKNYGVGN